MKVLVTGATGFIGKNLCAMLERKDEAAEVLRFTRESSNADLQRYINEADFIFHIAGVNRPETDKEFDTDNRQLTETIIDHLEALGKQTPLLFTSSTQAELDNSYGQSKFAAEEIVKKWAQTTGAQVYIYRLPGVFGKWCKPNYNSVVATFAQNIVHDKDVNITDSKKELNLVYVDDVVTEFLKALHNELPKTDDYFYKIPVEFKITLGQLVEKFRRYKTDREQLLVPSFYEAIDRNLYATFTSYFDEADIGYPLETRHDERGWLAEFIKSPYFGQIYVSRTNPGFTRGIHWHNTKIEKFLVIGGEAEIKLRKWGSSEVISRKVDGNKPEVMEMPAGYVHSIKNIGKKDMFLLIWSQQVFDPDNPDTYFEEV